ncbi:hypothetical protein ACT16_23140 [Mycobacterium heckeshornense]|nr:hypothetical protein ACT16_23140 [Mycobacterium heckeshornense]
MRAGAANLETRRPGRPRHLLELLATTDGRMHGLRGRTPVQRGRGRSTDTLSVRFGTADIEIPEPLARLSS